MTFLLHPRLDPSNVTYLTCMTAVVVCKAIEETFGVCVRIKWVNDIYYNDKKICGILSEGQTSIEDGLLSYLVIGIGINLYPPLNGFPDEIKDTAGSLLSRPNGENCKNLLYARIIKYFFDYCSAMDRLSFVKEYRDRSMLTGCRVKIFPSFGAPSLPGKNLKENAAALVKGIDDKCRLIVEYDDKTTEALFCGEVSVIKEK